MTYGQAPREIAAALELVTTIQIWDIPDDCVQDSSVTEVNDRIPVSLHVR